jgi:predicted TIM-barrel fold metal-dependent hydrolase
MIIDSHAHIYSPDEPAYPPRKDPYRPPAGKGTPEGLQAEMKAAGVDRAMLVQTTTFYSWDNSYVRDTGAKAGSWARTVVTLDPEDPHSPDVLYALVQRANARALRTYPVSQGLYDHPANRRLWAAVRDLGITVNSLLNRASHADELARLLADFPEVPVVLDHCIALDVKQEFDLKVRRVVELARFKNLHAKVTYLPTGSGEQYPFRDMHAATRQIIDAYGPDRCVWGSDYPTELWCPKVTYRQHLELFQRHLGLSKGEQDQILGGTAHRLWFEKK